MATNPRTPDSHGPQLERGPGGLPPVRPKGGGTGTALAILVAAILLAAIFYFMPRAPKVTRPKPGAEVPQQPASGVLNGQDIQLQDVTMTKAPVGGSLDLQGQMSNRGNQTINGIGIDVIFHGNGGAVAGTELVPVMALKKQGDTFVQDDLVTDPLKPNDTRPFRVSVGSVPSGWDQQMPELKIVTVTSHP